MTSERLIFCLLNTNLVLDLQIDASNDDTDGFCYTKNDHACPFSALKELLSQIEDDDEKSCVRKTLLVESPIENFDSENFRLGLELDDAIDYDVFNVQVCDDSVCDIYDMTFFGLEKVSIGKIMIDLLTLETFNWH